MRVGIVGLGYVGLPLAVAFAAADVDVVAVDLDQRRVDAINAGHSYIEDVPDSVLAAALGHLQATTGYAPLAEVDAVLICVPTPLTPNREPELRPLLGSAQELGGPLLERTGLRAGVDFHLAFSPERVDPGRTDFTLINTPKVIGGLTEACGDAAEAVYRVVCNEIVRVATPEAAELTKLLENIFRAVNIALVNELALLTDRMGIDIWEVIDAASTKPYGFMRFEPGPGMGGHCLPVDPFYLSWRAREFDMATEFIELAGKVNQQMPYHCVAKLQRTLNDRGLAVRGARIALLGVAYKPGVGDMRESPALKIIELLLKLGAEVVYHDPYVPALDSFELRSTPLAQAVAGSDLVLIVTAHPGIDYDTLAVDGACVFDLRGVTHPSVDAQVVRL